MRLALFFSLLLALSSASARAVFGFGGCSGEYRKLYRETRAARFLTEEDRSAILAVRSDPQIPSLNKARQIFHLVLAARVRASGVAEREWVEQALRTSVVKQSRQLNARYNGFSHRVTVKVPEYLLGSAVEYMLKIHELEHALQQGRVRAAGRRFFQWGTKVTLLTESDAISLEWRYLHELPPEMLAEIKTHIQDNGGFRGPMQKYLQAALDDAQKPFQDYIRHQRELGRYSKGQARTLTALSYGQVGTAVAATVYLIYSETKNAP